MYTLYTIFGTIFVGEKVVPMSNQFEQIRMVVIYHNDLTQCAVLTVTVVQLLYR